MAFKLDGQTDTVSVKFEDSMISIEEIIRRIEEGKFQVREAVEVPSGAEALSP